MGKITTLIGLIFAAFLLVGCGTTGKEYKVTLNITGNENTTINIDPSIVSDSGDSDTSSNNSTDLPIEADIGLNGAADALESGIIDSAVGALDEVL